MSMNSKPSTQINTKISIPLLNVENLSNSAANTVQQVLKSPYSADRHHDHFSPRNPSTLNLDRPSKQLSEMIIKPEKLNQSKSSKFSSHDETDTIPFKYNIQTSQNQQRPEPQPSFLKLQSQKISQDIKNKLQLYNSGSLTERERTGTRFMSHLKSLINSSNNNKDKDYNKEASDTYRSKCSTSNNSVDNY